MFLMFLLINVNQIHEKKNYSTFYISHGDLFQGKPGLKHDRDG